MLVKSLDFGQKVLILAKKCRKSAIFNLILFGRVTACFEGIDESNQEISVKSGDFCQKVLILAKKCWKSAIFNLILFDRAMARFVGIDE